MARPNEHVYEMRRAAGGLLDAISKLRDLENEYKSLYEDSNGNITLSDTDFDNENSDLTASQYEAAIASIRQIINAFMNNDTIQKNIYTIKE